MNTFKKLILALTIPLLSLSLLFLLITWAIVAFIGTPQPIKQTLANSNFYNNLAASILDKASNEINSSQQEMSININLEQPEIKAAAEKSFNPEFLQESTEKVIDGIYGWLDGSTSEPEFLINISNSKQSFIEIVADAAVKRVEALPVCTSIDQLAQVNDPFKASCRPPEFNVAAEKDKYINQVNINEGPFKDNKFTFENLQGEGQKPITEQFKNAPKTFQLLKKAPIIFGILSFIFTGIILLLYYPHSKAFYALSKIFLSTGIITLVITLIGWYINNKAMINTTDALQEDLFNGSRTVFNSIKNSLLIGSFSYCVIGFGSWLLAKKFEPPLTDEVKNENINDFLNSKKQKSDNLDTNIEELPNDKDKI